MPTFVLASLESHAIALVTALHSPLSLPQELHSSWLPQFRHWPNYNQQLRSARRTNKYIFESVFPRVPRQHVAIIWICCAPCKWMRKSVLRNKHICIFAACRAATRLDTIWFTLHSLTGLASLAHRLEWQKGSQNTHLRHTYLLWLKLRLNATQKKKLKSWTMHFDEYCST